MEWRRLGLCLLVVLWLGGCATNGGLEKEGTLRVGQRESDLVARKGQPQEVLPGTGGGKIYIYTTLNLDQVAAMGGGAWAKPDQVYYWLDNQGVITRVTRYPYGKRQFLFPSQEKPTQVAEAPEPRVAPPSLPVTTQAAPAPAPSAVAAPEQAPKPPAAPAPKKLARPVPTPAPAPAAAAEPAPRVAVQPPAVSPAPPARGGKEAATQLELNMTREEVRRVLGLPERTEGFKAGGRAVIVWYYLLEERQGRRVVTPLVFENGRLSGWGESHYRRLLREISGQKP
jgi:hypothetical protein